MEPKKLLQKNPKFPRDIVKQIIPRIQQSNSPIKYEIYSFIVDDKTRVRFEMKKTKNPDHVHITCQYNVNGVFRNEHTEEKEISLNTTPGLTWKTVVDDADLEGCVELPENQALAAALKTKSEFTRAEFDAFGVGKIKPNCYFQVDEQVFKPTIPILDLINSCVRKVVEMS